MNASRSPSRGFFLLMAAVAISTSLLGIVLAYFFMYPGGAVAAGLAGVILSGWVWSNSSTRKAGGLGIVFSCMTVGIGVAGFFVHL